MRLLNFKNINNWSEEKLVEECVNKNELAQKHLFEIYSNQMYAVCLRFFNHDEAFDVLNLSFIKVFNKLHLFNRKTQLKWWIRKIVVNTALDELRKNKRHKKLFVEAKEIKNQEVFDNDDISEFWEAAIKIPKEQLMIEINKLPAASKLVFNLYAIEEYSHKEIAKSLKISESTSRWHLSNSRRILKERVIKLVNHEINNEQKRKKY